MKNIDKNTLFLCGIIILCFSFLLFHLNPYQIADTEFWLWMNTFIYTLLWRPVATTGVIVGIIFIYKALKHTS